MTSKKPASNQGQGHSAPKTSVGKPRSFGEQWTAKGDVFTRSVQQPKHGSWSSRGSMAKPAR